MDLRLSLLPILAWMLVCCAAGADAQVVLQHYGVDDISTSQFGFLRDSLGGNFALVELTADSLVWKDAITRAEQNNISLIIWPLGHGDRYTPWLCNVFTWDISEGLGAMLWAERYVAAGGKGLTAVLTTHEPFYSANAEKVFTTYQLQLLYAALKNVAPHVKLFAYLNDISYYDSTQSYREMKDSVVDIAGTYKHHFGTKHTLKETLDEIESDYALIQRKGLNVQLYFALQCFATDGIEYRMPSAEEMRDYIDTVVATKKLTGVFWYPWDRSSTSYSQWLSKDRYDSTGADRWAVVREKSAYLITDVRQVEHARPVEFSLSQNYPNPANPTTSIDVSIASSGFYELRVFNLLGQDVAQIFHGQLSSGTYSFRFDARAIPSGVYFYVLRGSGVHAVRRMLIIR
jgi:hypothetical protein